ncbi:MAG: flippase-like domain-containing protein [Acidiferrobacteraceae bacterium]|nr:flippase-like domain-containing protein [Acidiferrobacteraceae bacterium]
MRTRFLLTALKILFSGGLLYWLIHDLELKQVGLVIADANIGLLSLAFMMFFLGYLITALRWRMLLSAQGVHARIGFLVQSFMVAIFFNNLLPSTIGGDVVRIYDSWRLGNSRSGAASVVIVDRLTGLLALASYALITVIAARQLADLVPALPALVLGATLAVGGLAWFVFFAPRQLYRSLEQYLDRRTTQPWRIIAKIASAFSMFSGRRDLLVRAFGLSLLLQLNVIVHFIIVSRALGIDIPVLAMFTVIPLSIFVTMLPVSINGIGLREGVFVFFFSAYGIDAVEAIAFAWIALGFVMLQGVIGGILFAARGENKQPS